TAAPSFAPACSGAEGGKLMTCQLARDTGFAINMVLPVVGHPRDAGALLRCRPQLPQHLRCATRRTVPGAARCSRPWRHSVDAGGKRVLAGKRRVRFAPSITDFIGEPLPSEESRAPSWRYAP